jgi:hypothetical protein
VERLVAFFPAGRLAALRLVAFFVVAFLLVAFFLVAFFLVAFFLVAFFVRFLVAMLTSAVNVNSTIWRSADRT